MRIDLPCLLRAAHALRDDADTVDDRAGVTSADLTIEGHGGFGAVEAVRAISAQWTDQLDSIGGRLRGIGDTVSLAATDLNGVDVDTGDGIAAAWPLGTR